MVRSLDWRMLKNSISPPSVIYLGEASLNQTVSDSNVPIFMDFRATWCGLGRMVAPVLEGLAEEQRTKRIKID